MRITHHRISDAAEPRPAHQPRDPPQLCPSSRPAVGGFDEGAGCDEGGGVSDDSAVALAGGGGGISGSSAFGAWLEAHAVSKNPNVR